MTNQIINLPFSSQHRAVSQPPAPTTKMTKTALERKTIEKHQSKNRDPQLVSCINLRNDLGVSDHFFTSDLSPSLSIGPRWVKNVLQDWTLNRPLPSVLRNEAWVRSWRHYHFLKTGCIDYLQQAAIFLNDQAVCYMLEMSRLQATRAGLEAMRLYCTQCWEFGIRPSRKLYNGHGHVLLAA